MPRPLTVALLWHQHQPYYRQGGRFLLPWTRLHATKDYLDIITAAERFATIRQTVNVVPSLLVQLVDYVDNGATDPQLELSRRPAAELGVEEQVEILRDFFLCNAERMILPYPRYRELYEQGARGDRDDPVRLRHAAASFSHQDWRDLQTWYNLTWIGPYSREREPFRSLLAKGRDFTEEEKHALLDASIGILREVIPTYRRLMDEGRIELSVTPFYHPILPILCDSFSALEAMPTMSLPTRRVHVPEDATAQIQRAVELYEHHFGRRPRGMWPSEGSVSDAALALIREQNFLWTATDEGVLRRTLGEAWRPTSRYFPYTLVTPHGPLWTLFRDHDLSDTIGFVYSSWRPEDAARDFHERLIEVRNRIIQERGVDALDQAVVPVILDGENCWEFYQDNGRTFLEQLYGLLEESSEIRTSTISGVLSDRTRRAERTLGRIYAGSWIGSNFRIWIGHEEDNRAWDALIDARQTLIDTRENIGEERFAEAMEEIYIAEGSDWFWWFGDEHTSANQDDFDGLFRYHLRRVYQIIGVDVPAELEQPIRTPLHAPRVSAPSGLIHPTIDGLYSSDDEWANAGHFVVASIGGAMHRADAAERRVHFGRDDSMFYFRYDPAEQLGDGALVRFTVGTDRRVVVSFTRESIAIESSTDAHGRVRLVGMSAAVQDVLEAAIPLTHFRDGGGPVAELGVYCEIFEDGHETERFPQQGEVRMSLEVGS